jgi:predicted metal-dependent hydrolase
VILCFIFDLIFIVKVEEAAKRLGYKVEYVERAEQIAAFDESLPERQLAEHLVGPGAVLIEKISALQPVLIIVDLNNQEIPWREWVAMIKSVPATRRIPLICFGSHVDATTMQEAKGRGADAVVARSRFSSALLELIQKYARIPDYEALEIACQEALSVLAAHAIEQFNRGEYFEAHETLEEAWNEDETAGRELYRAILQVAVAYLQIERKNYAGAIKMFLRVRQWIAPFPDQCYGVDVAQLKDDAQRAYDHLVKLGPGRIEEFPRDLLRSVRRI